MPDSTPPLNADRLLDRLQAAWTARELDSYLALWRFETPAAREEEESFARPALAAGETRLTLERPSSPTTGRALELVARTLEINEPRGRLDQWRLRLEDGADGWRLVARRPLGQIDGLVHLSLDPAGFSAQGVVLRLPDFELRFEQGTLFTAPASLGPTVLVFVGRARLSFRPRPAAEREQLRQFSGQPELHETVEQAFVRLHPADWHHLLENADLRPDPQAASRWPAAQRLFASQAQQSHVLDVDLPHSPWWLLPGLGDALVSFRSRHGLLTFTVSRGQAEALSLFDREKRRQVCLYPLEGQNTRYNEDKLRDTDVLEHRLRARFEPDPPTIVAEDTLRVRTSGASTLRLRLHDTLRVISVTSPEGGNHLFFRVRNQDSLVVSLGPLAGRPEITLSVRYAGPLQSGRIEHEAQVPGQEPIFSSADEVPLQTVQVFSNRALWYPQVEPDDYALAELELDVPVGYTAVAGGARTPRAGGRGRSVAAHKLEQPAKYLAVALGRLSIAGQARLGGVRLTVWSVSRKRTADAARVLEQSRNILAFYERLFGADPYPDLNLVLAEADSPGGHSPAGMVVLSERPLTRKVALREDPATLWSIPGFFLAHELAHQWWGQGVSGQNYHERWLSEGAAQYAAALWARHAHGEETFQSVLRHLARWATRKTGEGPIHLGHRLGHLKQDPQIYRAVVYSKGAYVLHMLRALVGAEPFERALLAFQERHRFAKAGTDDLREALEAAAGQDLSAYFEAWIYGTELPVLSVASVQRTVAGRYETTVSVAAQNVPAPLPLEIALFHDGRATRTRVVLPPAGGSFKIESATRPGRIDVNADGSLLAVVRRQ